LIDTEANRFHVVCLFFVRSLGQNVLVLRNSSLVPIPAKEITPIPSRNRALKLKLAGAADYRHFSDAMYVLLVCTN
jgi:hypothetical protein